MEADITTQAVGLASNTDFSILNAPSNGDIDRARVYWYKIVPIFDNTPLLTTNNQNITFKTVTDLSATIC